jgi:hypothetical protein
MLAPALPTFTVGFLPLHQMEAMRLRLMLTVLMPFAEGRPWLTFELGSTSSSLGEWFLAIVRIGDKPGPEKETQISAYPITAPRV